jgi:MscS family membrane protein
MGSYLFLFLFSISQMGWASQLTYVKTDTPRDTMETFLVAMNDYRAGVLENDSAKKARIYDAIRCLAEDSRTMISSQREKELAAIFLKEFLDRVIVIDLNKIPEEVERNRWRLKNTEIVLKPQTEGEREGEWLITEGTWRRAHHFYDKVKELPYLDGSGQGALYIQPWMEKYLPEWSKQETLRLKNWQWLGLVIGFFLGLLLRLLTYTLLALYKNLTLANQFINWKKDLILQIEKPLALMAAAGFWYLWIHYLKLEGLAFALVNGLIQLVFGVAITWAAYRCANVLGNQLKLLAEKTESQLDNQLVPFVDKAIKICVVLLGALLVLQNMGINVFSLLAGLGLGGLAFALAARDTAANLFGSIMILTDRPFKVGDWVKVGEVEGTVEEVGFRSTRVRTFYNSLITVPNANMATAQIDNLGARQYRRTSTTLDITYDTPKEKIVAFTQGIRQIIVEHPISRKDLIHVYFSAYGSASLKIMVYFFLITNDWGEELKSREQILLQIFDLAHELDVEFAFPTQTLYLKEGDPLPENFEPNFNQKN